MNFLSLSSIGLRKTSLLKSSPFSPIQPLSLFRTKPFFAYPNAQSSRQISFTSKTQLSTIFNREFINNLQPNFKTQAVISSYQLNQNVKLIRHSSTLYNFVRPIRVSLLANFPSIASRWTRNQINGRRWLNLTLLSFIILTLFGVLIKGSMIKALRKWDEMDDLSRVNYFTLINFLMSYDFFILGLRNSSDFFVFVLSRIYNSHPVVQSYAMMILLSAAEFKSVGSILAQKINWNQVLRDLDKSGQKELLSGVLLLLHTLASKGKQYDYLFYGLTEEFLLKWLNDPKLSIYASSLLAFTTTDYRVAQKMDSEVITLIHNNSPLSTGNLETFEKRVKEYGESIVSNSKNFKMSTATEEQYEKEINNIESGMRLERHVRLNLYSVIILSNLIKNSREFEQLKNYTLKDIDILQSMTNHIHQRSPMLVPKIPWFVDDIVKFSLIAGIWGSLRWYTTKKQRIVQFRGQITRTDSMIIQVAKEGFLCSLSTFTLLSFWKIFHEYIHKEIIFENDTTFASRLYTIRFLIFSPVAYVSLRLLSPFSLFPTCSAISFFWFIYSIQSFNVPPAFGIENLIKQRKEESSKKRLIL